MKKFVGAAMLSLFTVSPSFAAKVVIDHYMGQTELEQSPERVVVIGFGPLDALDNFGIDPVAVSNSSNLPSYLSKYSKDNYTSAGSLFEPDFETIFLQSTTSRVRDDCSSYYQLITNCHVFSDGSKELAGCDDRGETRALQRSTPAQGSCLHCPTVWHSSKKLLVIDSHGLRNLLKNWAFSSLTRDLRNGMAVALLPSPILLPGRRLRS